MSNRWLIYALGGGLGHLVRGLALARAAERRGIDTRLLTNSPFAPLVPIANEMRGEPVVIDAGAARDEVSERVRVEIGRRDFDLLVVDTFPRGLAGELAELEVGAPRALVHRDLTPVYCEKFNLRETARTYDLVLAPGERGPLANESTVETGPWLIRDADELLSPEKARAQLGADDDRPVVGVIASGNPREAAAAEQRARTLAGSTAAAHVRLLSPGSGTHSRQKVPCPPFWPLIRWLPGVDLLVGAGGYNTVYEARAVGVPLIATAQERLYDRQERRLRPDERVTPNELGSRVGSVVRRRGKVSTFTNGVHAAVAALCSVTQGE